MFSSVLYPDLVYSYLSAIQNSGGVIYLQASIYNFNSVTKTSVCSRSHSQVTSLRLPVGWKVFYGHVLVPITTCSTKTRLRTCVCRIVVWKSPSATVLYFCRSRLLSEFWELVLWGIFSSLPPLHSYEEPSSGWICWILVWCIFITSGEARLRASKKVKTGTVCPVVCLGVSMVVRLGVLLGVPMAVSVPNLTKKTLCRSILRVMTMVITFIQLPRVDSSLS